MDKDFNNSENELLHSLSEDEIKLIFSDVVDFGVMLAKGAHCSNSGASTLCGGGTY